MLKMIYEIRMKNIQSLPRIILRVFAFYTRKLLVTTKRYVNHPTILHVNLITMTRTL